MEKIKSLLKDSWRSLKMSFAFSGGTTTLLIISTIIVSILPVWQAKIMGDLVNQVVKNLSIAKVIGTGLLGVIAMYAFLWAFTRIVGAIKLYVYKKWHMDAELGLEIIVMKKRAEIDLGHYENPDFQNLLYRAFDRSIWPVFELLEIQFQSFGSIATLILTSFIAFNISPLVYLIIVLTSIPMFVVNLKYGSKAWTVLAENSQRQRKYHHLRSHINNRVGVTQTKLLQASDKIIGEAESILSDFRRSQLKIDKASTIWSSIASVISAIGVGFGFYLIIIKVVGGETSIGSMVFLTSILGQLVGSINGIFSDISRMFERDLYVSDIFKVLDTKPFIKRSKKPIRLHLSGAPEIEFKNIWFKYDGREDWILQNINLKIMPGEKIALVGENGAGKSTLVKLLARIYDPTIGDIFINGVNLKDIDPDEWSSYLAVLLQDYKNYDFTLNDSVAMGQPNTDLNRSKVENSVRFAGAEDFISSWKDGFDQQIGKEFDGGVEPSKGQNQKIALARTIYREGFVTVLDEPTAAIDALSESRIFEQMEQATNGRTLIVITHRFNTTQTVNRIIVLDKGTIVEQGNHKELVSANGLYSKMFEVQAKVFREAEVEVETEDVDVEIP